MTTLKLFQNQTNSTLTTQANLCVPFPYLLPGSHPAPLIVDVVEGARRRSPRFGIKILLRPAPKIGDGQSRLSLPGPWATQQGYPAEFVDVPHPQSDNLGPCFSFSLVRWD